MRSVHLGILLALSFTALPASSLLAQETDRSAAISGVITDAARGAVASATVALRGPGVQRDVASDAAGTYRFTALAPGTYTVTIVVEGFAAFERTDIVVSTGQTTTIDAVLEVAGLRESVSVAAAALAAPAEISRLPVALDRLPQAVSLVSREVIQEQHAVALTDALRNVSGVASRGTDAGTNEDFTIRGFQINSGRNFFRDGMRFFNGYVTETGSLDRVEVLKGPASILFGSVEPGGVINLVSRSLSSPARRELSLDLGSHGDTRVRFDANGALSDSWRYRAYTSFRQAESFRDQVDGRRYYAEGAIGWMPSPRQSVTVTLVGFNDRQTPDTGIPAIGDLPADVDRDSYYGEPYNRDSQSGGSVVVKWVMTGSRIRSTHSLGYYDQRRDRYEATPQNATYGLPGQDGFPGLPRRINRQLFINDYRLRELATQQDVAIKLTTGTIRHTLSVGYDTRAFKSIEDADDGLPFRAAYFIDLDEPVHVADPPVIPGYPVFFRLTDQRQRSVGVYVQDSVEIGRHWTVLGGVRYDHDRLTQDQLTTTTASFERASNSATPRAGIVYKPVEPLSLYGSYSRSFSPRTGTIFPNTPVEPERAEQYEVGAKASLGGRASATIAVYELTREDVVVADPVRNSYSLQVGEQRSRGVEADFSVRPAAGLSVTGTYAFTDATIREDTRLAIGNRLDNVARHAGSIWGSQRLGGTRGVTVGAGLFLVGRRQGNLENNFQLPGYTRADAMVSVPVGELALSLNVTNLTNRTYYLNAWRRDRVMPGAPRQVAFSVRYVF